MKKNLNLFIAILVCLTLNQTRSFASSHREAPLISSDPLADNTDVYAFRSPVDTNRVVLIANYIPFEHPAGGPNWYFFGENIRYEIHVKNQATTMADDIVYRFTFKLINEDSTTFFDIRLGKQNNKNTYTLERSMGGGAFIPIITNGIVPPPNIGPRSIEGNPVGLSAPNYDTLMRRAITTAPTGERVFAGPIDDPFFADLGGIFDVGNFRKPGRDGLAKFNVHSLVIEVPISTLQKDKKTTAQATSILDADYVIGVYATASRPAMTTFDANTGMNTTSGNYIQVSRLGMPLTNEVVIPIGSKDNWNSVMTNTSEEAKFDKFIVNPELALYMDDSKFGSAIPGLSDLRIQTNSLGKYDFRNGMPGLFPLKGTPAVNGTALAESAFGGFLLPNNSSPRAVDLLPIFKTGVPNLRPYQLATGKNGDPLAAGKPFVNNFLPTFGDMLRLNMAVPVTPRNSADFSSLGLVQAAALGLTDARFNGSTALQNIPNMDGFPNGRRLEDDVTTIELQAVGGVILAALGLSYENPAQLGKTLGFNAGVTKNDTTLKTVFPFVQGPWRGITGPQYVGPRSEQTVPVTFVKFTADKTGQKVLLRWEVVNELNVSRYEVEQSVDGLRYQKIGTVSVGAANTNSYELTDANPSLDKSNLYRIKQIDKDGKFTYTDVRMVKFGATNIITVTPNPAVGFIKVFSTQSPLQISLFDQGGKKVMSQILVNGSGQFNISSLAKGVYTVVAESNGVRVESKKIVKQ
jgi:hypothetical protein